MKHMQNNNETYSQYTRKYCEAHPTTLFVFTDNTDRTSGHNIISPESWYSKKYGQGHCYPVVSTAQIRGLNNAYPISTQRWYHYGAKGKNGQWKNEDFELFKSVIDSEISDIDAALASHRFTELVFCNSIVNGYISEITLQRTPDLYNYLIKQLTALTNKWMRKSLFD